MKQLTLQAKRLLPFCLFSFLLLFSGCGGDDELSMPEVIVGTWTVDNYEVLGDDTEYTVYIDRFEFRKDQTFTVYYGLAPGQDVVDDPANLVYPMPLETAGKDDVYVGRVRKDLSDENGLTFWLSGDQIRKGAALNAVQIGEYLIKVNGLKK